MTARPLLALVLLGSTLAHAAPRKVLVLPLDGTADPALRTKLSASIQKLARVVDGQVDAGNTTLGDTAAAVGCDAEKPSCVESVRKTLGVDELIYGTADARDGGVTIVVRRAGKGAPAREITTTLAASDPAERADSAILPLFTGTGGHPVGGAPDPMATSTNAAEPPTTEPAVEPPPAEPLPTPAAPVDTPPRRERSLAIAGAIGGGAMVLIGLALWSSKSSIQDEIDDHRTETVEDFAALRELESTASTRAWAGNFMVLGGLALGGYAAWWLWKDHQAQRGATISPQAAPDGTGAMIVVRGWL